MSKTSAICSFERAHEPTREEAPLLDLATVGASEHFVQFYEDDDFLVNSVNEYVASGFRQGDSAIIIATQSHRQELEKRLLEQGFNMVALRLERKYRAFDAMDTLSKFMVDGRPDPKRFAEVVGTIVGQAAAGGAGVRAFGEMVALLWADGKKSAAIELEELWNGLAKQHAFALFCAYPMSGFSGESNGVPFIHVCKAHSRVIPSESYARPSSTVDERLRTISLLQQKAASLEAEIAVRKETEQALLRRERELSDFLENATEPIHKVGADGKILWANRAELELLGYEDQDYVGRNIAEFHADPEVIQDILARLARGEQLHDYEARLKHKDGSIRHVSINSSVYWDEDRFGHTKCFTRDITTRKQQSELMEQMVLERTARLQETMAELEAFSYSISHDMRSPLRAMQGYARSLISDYGSTLDDKAVLWLKRIARAASRLDLLVRDVLAYSKVSKGEIELKPIELGPLVEDIIQQHPELDQMREFIQVEAAHRVLGHEAYVSQCLTNLIENSLKFTTPGLAPRVTVRSEKVGGQVRLSVEDNGIGIHADHHDRIFRIFGRVHSDKKYEGTGIGLAIVSKAVTKMGGKVGFESECGCGSRFWFTLAEAANAN